MEIANAIGALAARESIHAILQSIEVIAASEFLRLGIVYVHLIACCVAIGLVFTSDLSFVAQLLKRDQALQDPDHLTVLQKSVSVALVALWISGIAIVALDASRAGWSYYLNPKLQAKVVIVCLLTLNGLLLLHHVVMPALKRAGSLLNLPLGGRMLSVFAGAVSAVSWFYAAMLGIGRPLNWKYSLEELLVMYPLFVACGFVAMLSLTAWAKYQRPPGALPAGGAPALSL